MNSLCPDDALMAGLATNELSSSDRAELLKHIAECERCRKAAAVLVTTVDPTRVSTVPSGSLPETLEPGLALGPYHLVRLLGSGAMGTVFAAWDPRLDRQVALKVLHRNSAALRDEAKLMAKLSHPNIVTVHEVADWQDRVVLVMELISGGTLREWLAKRPPLRDVIAVFTQLAHALAAAHAAGVVHRDFKPDNVLIDVTGRPRLTDFGLGTLASSSSTAVALVGTPAYLAPAQLEGRPGDASADQFAFCVSLWEAVTGERPFRASTLAQLRAVQRLGPVKQTGRAFPRWLEGVIRRGLAYEPEHRFPSMAAVARALARGPSQTPRRVAAGVAAAAAVSAWAWHATREPCAGAGAELDAWVTSSRLVERETAFVSAGPPFAGTAAAETNRLLGDYVATWRRSAMETCRAERVEKRLTPERIENTRQCLELRRKEFEALLVALAHPTVELVAEAPSAVLSLRDVESCLDDRQPASGAAEQAIRLEIAALRHQVASGEPTEVTQSLERLRQRASDKVAASAELSWLAAQYAMRRYDSTAPGKVRECTRRALYAQQDAIAAECFTYLAMLMSLRDRKPAEARAALELAEALSARTPPSIRSDVNLTIARIHVSRVEGQHEESLRISSDAVHRLSAAVGDRHLHVLTMKGYQSMKLAALGRHAEAYELNQALVTTMNATLGEEHPAALVVQNNQSLLARKMGHFAEAREAAQFVFRVRSRTLGPKNYGTMAAQLNVAAAEARLGNLEVARPLLEGVLAAVEANRGAEHFDMVEPLEEMALVLAESGSKQEAAQMLGRALALRRANNDTAFRIAQTEELLRGLAPASSH